MDQLDPGAANGIITDLFHLLVDLEVYGYRQRCALNGSGHTSDKAGERTGVLDSYLSTYDKMPRSESEWQDVIKIANGRWPDERVTSAETEAAAKHFARIYQRQADMKRPNDNAAARPAP